MEGSVAVALNNPSNLKLGQLGHIAGGNANNTSATSLASTCRGSASSTSMWGDFKIGTVTISSTKTAGGTGQDKGTFGMRFKGDVGDYMDATRGNQLVLEGQLTTAMDSSNWVGYVEETVFEVNMLSIDENTILVNNYNKQVFDFLEKHHIAPVIAPFRHRWFWDGGVHCVTQDLYRERNYT